MLGVVALIGTCSAQRTEEKNDGDLGRRLVVEFLQEAQVRPSPDTDAIQQYIQTIGDRLTAALPHHPRYTFTYYSSPAFKSAFALPGKQVIVGGGLLAIAQSEDEIANVLAHEIEHSELGQVQLRTTEVEEQKKIGAEKLNVTDYFAHYSKAQELSCDRNGAILAQAAGYSPGGMLSLLETFKAMRKGEPETTFPDKLTLDERIQQVKQMFVRSELKPGKPQSPIHWP
ncbi:MAG TPA: M48 family metallopeptidase [Terriglobales bacterium]